MVETLEIHLIYELGFHYFVGGFSNGVVVRTSLHPQRMANIKGP